MSSPHKLLKIILQNDYMALCHMSHFNPLVCCEVVPQQFLLCLMHIFITLLLFFCFFVFLRELFFISAEYGTVHFICLYFYYPCVVLINLAAVIQDLPSSRSWQLVSIALASPMQFRRVWR